MIHHRRLAQFKAVRTRLVAPLDRLARIDSPRVRADPDLPLGRMYDTEMCARKVGHGILVRGDPFDVHPSGVGIVNQVGKGLVAYSW